MATTPMRRIRVSDDEWESWRRASSGNVSAWLRDLANSSVGQRAERQDVVGIEQGSFYTQYFKSDFKK